MVKMRKMLVHLSTFALVISIIPISTASAHEVSTKSEAADLRMAFGQLLGEHAVLAAIAMQKGIDVPEAYLPVIWIWYG